MSDATDDRMVLRTIYLPLELDRRLRLLAFSRSISKANLMRGFIEEGLAKVAASGERTLAERLAAQAAGSAVEEGEKVVDRPSAKDIQRSITPEALISFLDGKPYKTLKRHLSTHGLDFETYRTRYGLPADYPTVSADYSAARSALAKDLGLGRQRRKPVAPVEAKQPKARAKAAG